LETLILGEKQTLKTKPEAEKKKREGKRKKTQNREEM